MLIRHGEVALADSDRVVERMSFAPGDPNTRAQLGAWRGVCFHWTGGERGVDPLVRVLRARRLSCHFLIETDGTIYQLADLATICAHMGRPGNASFLGVEIVCRGFATAADLRGADLRSRDEIDWAVKRDVYRDYVGKHRTGFASFGPAQVRSALWLAECLAGVCGFPRAVPAKLAPKVLRTSPLDWERLVVDHEGRRWVPSMDRSPGSGAKSFAATHLGAVGHFHTHATKYDPGPQLFYQLWVEGWNPAGRKIVDFIPLP